MEDSVITFQHETYSGKFVTCRIDPRIDIRDFEGTAGFPLLVLAAATHAGLSIGAVWTFLVQRSYAAPHLERMQRSRTYLQRRRWLFLPPGASNYGNRDGKDPLALKIVAQNPEVSLRDLVLLLKESGVTRSREWVRRQRGSQVTHVRHN